jgi:hypothetical protein
MAPVITLEGEGGALRLETDARGWTDCFLVAGGGETYLGGDTRARLVPRLLAGLDPLAGPPIGRLAGHDVHWVLTLSEAHHTLYAADENGARLLIWQAPDTAVAGTISLSPARQAEWRSRLTSS